jgi:hypothetical protein
MFDLAVPPAIAGRFPCPVCGAEAAFSCNETHRQTDCPACLTVYRVPAGL